MNTSVALSRLPKIAPAPARRASRAGVEESEALIAAASDDELAFALRLVAWNPRDLGHFLKTHATR
jgi:hypothetical protein